MKGRLYLILIFLFLIIIVINIPIFAHKVNIFTYVEGNKVYTESYFNDGKKCVSSKMEVFDNQGNKWLEGLTDQEGNFSFEIPQEEGDLKIVLTASMGHRAECIIRADELRNTTGLVQENLKEPTSKESTESILVYKMGEENKVVSPEISSQNLKEVQLLIENILDEKLTPVMREIKKSQEDKISPTEIIGGIGYIFGIFGIIAYFLSRKK
ncbi:MAG: hypothetical protein COZ07_02930 [Candidatus Infernicultor aquiphilus]|uniref:Nickel transport protein n=1 Tax=Candidatus Infernicultor aquiphilus TaxID=1805029 RepID=A0A2M7PRH0_9BACT|nr:MAG: hypothetical protein COZ07_02930 [Candidatus Atribacteria bacterium CG_4_10_14_3_um_filter_34_13]